MSDYDCIVESVDEFAALIVELCANKHSLGQGENYETLKLSPPTEDEYVIEALETYFPVLREMLCGICDACQQWTPKRVRVYWAEMYYCLSCCEVTLRLCEKRGFPALEEPISMRLLSE